MDKILFDDKTVLECHDMMKYIGDTCGERSIQKGMHITHAHLYAAVASIAVTVQGILSHELKKGFSKKAKKSKK